MCHIVVRHDHHTMPILDVCWHLGIPDVRGGRGYMMILLEIFLQPTHNSVSVHIVREFPIVIPLYQTLRGLTVWIHLDQATLLFIYGTSRTVHSSIPTHVRHLHRVMGHRFVIWWTMGGLQYDIAMTSTSTLEGTLWTFWFVSLNTSLNYTPLDGS